MKSPKEREANTTMDMTYRGTITKTYNYYGYPQAEKHFKIVTDYFTCEIVRYGNQGMEYPKITPKDNLGHNGYFWSMHAFNELLWNGKFDQLMRDLKENESKKFILHTNPRTIELKD